MLPCKVCAPQKHGCMRPAGGGQLPLYSQPTGRPAVGSLATPQPTSAATPPHPPIPHAPPGSPPGPAGGAAAVRAPGARYAASGWCPGRQPGSQGRTTAGPQRRTARQPAPARQQAQPGCRGWLGWRVPMLHRLPHPALHDLLPRLLPQAPHPQPRRSKRSSWRRWKQQAQGGRGCCHRWMGRHRRQPGQTRRAAGSGPRRRWEGRHPAGRWAPSRRWAGRATRRRRSGARHSLRSRWRRRSWRCRCGRRRGWEGRPWWWARAGPAGA